MGSAELIARCCKTAYDQIASNFSGYLQNYKNQIFREDTKISWLPYEFQAIWSYEVAMFYPFLFTDKRRELEYDSVMATLLRVDMLHFAGTWPENAVYKKGPFMDPGSLGEYYDKFPEYSREKLEPKAYGRIRPRK